MDACRIGRGWLPPAEDSAHYGVLGDREERSAASAVPTVRPPHRTQSYQRGSAISARTEKYVLDAGGTAQLYHTASWALSLAPSVDTVRWTRHRAAGHPLDRNKNFRIYDRNKTPSLV